jgi:hypothetical protein
MVDYTESDLLNMAIHFIGNRSTGGELFLSEKNIETNSPELKDELKEYLIAPYKDVPAQQFTHLSDLELNAMYNYATRIFAQPNTFDIQSQNIAKHLYNCSAHPGIKEGELLIGLIDNLYYNDEALMGIALIKSESKDTFFKTPKSRDGFSISVDEGIRKDKIDKACLILNTHTDNGLIVMVIDRTNSKDEAIFWRNTFLDIKPVADSYNKTEKFMTLTRNFIKDKLPEEFEVNKTDQIELLNKSVNFFKQNEEFEYKNFVREVIQEPGMIKSFGRYKEEFAQANPLALEDDFAISNSAVKRQSRIFKSVLKLDKNFHVYIHGDNQLIEKGYDDDKRMNYYKLFFKDES